MQQSKSPVNVTKNLPRSGLYCEAVPVTLCPLRGVSRIGHLRTEVFIGPKRHPVGI